MFRYFAVRGENNWEIRNLMYERYANY
jgi:hypothetical protein